MRGIVKRIKDIRSFVEFFYCSGKMEMGSTGSIMVLALILFWDHGFSQTPDIVRVEYMLMPTNDADAKLSRMKLVMNVPIKVGNSDNIILGSEYNRMAFDLSRGVPYNDVISHTFHVVDLNMAYVLQYNADWRFVGVVTPRISSTLVNPLEKGDVSVNVTVGAILDKQQAEKPSRLVLGIAYNSTVALRVPLPVIYYEKRFHPNWTYVVGAPKSGFKYHINERHLLQTEFILDGYYVNLQGAVIGADSGIASSISSSAALVTFGYQYTLAKNMFLYGYVGHTLFQDNTLRDYDRNNIFTLNDEPSFYFRTGFRIGI